MQGIGLVVPGIMKSPIVGIRFFSQQKYFISPDGIMAMSYGLQGWSKKNPSLPTRLGLHLPSNSTALPGWGRLAGWNVGVVTETTPDPWRPMGSSLCWVFVEIITNLVDTQTNAEKTHLFGGFSVWISWGKKQCKIIKKNCTCRTFSRDKSTSIREWQLQK